jgi:hypothetical protein
MTTAPAVQPRFALGLPAGSVRALLTLMVLGLCWALMAMAPPAGQKVQIPLYLYTLMFLILGHFFAAHGHSIAGPTTGSRSPLYLPAGTLRTLIVLGFVGVFGWRFYTQRELIEFQPILEEAWLPVVILAAFFLGILVARFASVVLRGPTGLPYWYQDVMAWVALLAMIGLTIEVIVVTIVNPSLQPDRQLNVPTWQGILSAVVSFYFGARS